MHDLEKKLFQLEELLFLSLQTSLTKYISSMIDCNNKQQKFLFYGIQFFKSNYLHEKESNSFSPEDTTHRTTACIACGASNKARMYYFSICTRILQRNLVKLSNPTRVLPKFLVSCRSAEPKKESNSINLDFYKCLNFLLSMSCSIHFLKNPIPQKHQSKPIILSSRLSYRHCAAG